VPPRNDTLEVPVGLGQSRTLRLGNPWLARPRVKNPGTLGWHVVQTPPFDRISKWGISLEHGDCLSMFDVRSQSARTADLTAINRCSRCFDGGGA
jgi:hypothetical protein